MAIKKVLVTGVSGLIGGAVWDRLRVQPDRYELYGLSRRTQPSARTAPDRRIEAPAGRWYRADITDFAAVRPAVEGKDVVVHMAADPNANAPWESVLPNNVVGTYNVLEASRLAGVRRVIYASTIMVTWNYLLEEPYKAIALGRYRDVPPGFPVITKEWPVRPGGFYAASKVWGEALARYYWDVHGMSVICLRIGGVRHPDEPPHNPLGHATWCSQRDVAQMVQRCTDAPADLGFDIFYAVSRNRWRFVDIEHARRMVGYEPLDGAGDPPSADLR